MRATLLTSIALVLTCGALVAAASGADDITVIERTDRMRRQMEAAAEKFSHFATEDVISNRSPDASLPKELRDELTRLEEELRTWAKRLESVRALIGHANPKVRTLVLGALYDGENPHDLPLIASLMSDQAPTFDWVLSNSFSTGPQKNRISDFVYSQTIGDIAQRMIASYVPLVRRQNPPSFAAYWSAREGRKTCAGWFRVKMGRATRNMTPSRPEFQCDVDRVISELKNLPRVERAWTQVFLRCTNYDALDGVLTDAVCIADLKQIGPDQIVRFLERQRATNDPDLWFDDLNNESGNNYYSWMAHYILRHAHELLRVQDAEALLTCEENQRKTNHLTHSGASPWWAASAAELVGESDPVAAKQVIDAALGRYPLSSISGGLDQSVLIASLWRTHGLNEKQWIVDWFYAAQASPSEKKGVEFNHGPVSLLNYVRTAGRSDTKALLTALIADPRFEQADSPVLRRLIEIASDDFSPAIADREEINRVRRLGNTNEGLQAISNWRDQLKRKYKL